MANYFEMTRDELTAEKAALEENYKKFQAMGLKLNMARGKPGPHQMDLAMGLLQMNDYTTDAGTDARNYGDLEGLHEARELFGDVMGVKPEEVFVGGNSSLQIMYNLISMGYCFGFPESPCPWSQVEKRKFLCPAPGYDRHFAITEEFGFELISVPMTPTGPDMDVVEKLVAEDDTIKGIWCVPQYSNPDGYTYSDETIDRFAKMKTAAPDFKIFWDEAYIVHHLTEEIIAQIKNICHRNDTEEPNIFTEFGSFTVGESGAALYSIVNQKQQNDRENWYMIDSSFITTLPDTWGINQRYIMLAINNWDKEYQRVLLGGLTCDSEDFYNSESHINAIFLPKLEPGNPQYIGFFHTGAYQESIGGFGGIQHCLIPAPKHVIIDRDKDDNEYYTRLFAKEQSYRSMLRILGY